MYVSLAVNTPAIEYYAIFFYSDIGRALSDLQAQLPPLITDRVWSDF